MREGLLIGLVLIFASVSSQTVSRTDTIGSASKTNNIYNKALYSDSLCSSFCIVIKNEVKAHRHVLHSEHVIVLEGEGQMRLDDKTFTIKKGDVIFIQKNRVHAVKSVGVVPLKVISIQAPTFDGSDRVMVDR
jgi:mannose-6-phosphate isomerase-like protein (cupin superfamily)